MRTATQNDLSVSDQTDARARLAPENDLTSRASFSAHRESGNRPEKIGTILSGNRLHRASGIKDHLQRIRAGSRSRDNHWRQLFILCHTRSRPLRTLGVDVSSRQCRQHQREARGTDDPGSTNGETPLNFTGEHSASSGTADIFRRFLKLHESYLRRFQEAQGRADQRAESHFWQELFYGCPALPKSWLLPHSSLPHPQAEIERWPRRGDATCQIPPITTRRISVIRPFWELQILASRITSLHERGRSKRDLTPAIHCSKY